MSLFGKTKSWWERNEGKISAGALLLGFIFDSLTLKRIDLLYENVVIFSYLVIVAFGILFLSLIENHIGESGEGLFYKMHALLLIVVQFAFGGLFSAFFIFYSRSATIASSWPFLLFLLFFLVGNEIFKKKYTLFVFRISIFFIALFSFAIFYVPIIFNRIGDLVFLASGLVSLLGIFIFLKLLSFFLKERVENSKYVLGFSITSIFLLVNLFYFTNIIPPIPLSLKEVEVVNFIERTNTGDYRIIEEEKPWHAFLRRETITVPESNPRVFVFASVFAPTDLEARIVHEWQYYSEDSGEWVFAGEIPYSISGGKDGGFRGYSLKSNVNPGLWRVDIKTEGGQLIGRKTFEIFISDEIENLQERIL